LNERGKSEGGGEKTPSFGGDWGRWEFFHCSRGGAYSAFAFDYTSPCPLQKRGFLSPSGGGLRGRTSLEGD